MSSVSREFVIQNKNLHLHWELKCCVSYTSRHKCCVSDGETERSVRCVCVDIKPGLCAGVSDLMTRYTLLTCLPESVQWKHLVDVTRSL